MLVRADRMSCHNRQWELAWNKKRVHPRKPEATIMRWENPSQKAPKESKRMSCITLSLVEMKGAKCLVSRIKRSALSKECSIWLRAVCENPVKDLFVSELVYLYQCEKCPLNAHLRLFTQRVPLRPTGEKHRIKLQSRRFTCWNSNTYMYIRHRNRAGIYLTFSEEANGAYLCKSIAYDDRVLGGCQGVVMQLLKCFQCFSVSFF